MKKTFGKIMTLFMVICITMALAVPAFAADRTYVGEYDEYETYKSDYEYYASSWMDDVVEKYDLEFYQDPTEPATRGEVLLVFLRAIQEYREEMEYRPLEALGYTATFDDLSSVLPEAQTEVAILQYYGILAGDNEGNMNFSDYITRAEFAAIITRLNDKFFGFYGERTAKTFSDVSATAWYANYVSYAYQIGLMDGTTSTTFNPDGLISIQEVIKVMDNIVIKSEDHDDDDYLFTGSSVSHALSYTLDVTSEYDEDYSSDAAITSIEFEDSSLTLEVGEYDYLDVEIYPTKYDEYDLAWSVSNTSVVTVSSSGKVTAKAAGTAYVYAKANGKTDSIKITVTEEESDEVTSLYFTSSSITLEEGDTEYLDITIYPSSYDEYDLDWSTTDSSVATISSSGKVTAKSEGYCYIYAESDDVSDKIKVTVTSSDDDVYEEDEDENLNSPITNVDSVFIFNDLTLFNGQKLSYDYGTTIYIDALEYDDLFDGTVKIGSSYTNGEVVDKIMKIDFKLTSDTKVTFSYENGEEVNIYFTVD